MKVDEKMSRKVFKCLIFAIFVFFPQISTKKFLRVTPLKTWHAESLSFETKLKGYASSNIYRLVFAQSLPEQSSTVKQNVIKL